YGVFATAFKTAGEQNMFAAPNNELCGSAAKPCTIFQTTTDGGASWTRHVIPVAGDYAPSPGAPLVAADPSRKGHFAVAVPMSQSGGFRVYQTRDSGSSWQGPVMATEDATKRHFHGSMAFS